MSRVLSKLLNESEVVMGNVVGKLEELSSYESRDLRVLDENSQTVRRKSADLGLDPNDTTARELYYALNHRFAADCQAVKHIYQENSAEKTIRKIAKAAQIAQSGKEVWVLKHSATKLILKANPPKPLMRKLGYRSIESMLKHEDTSLIMAALPYCVSSRWKEKFESQFAKLSPLDFETKKLTTVTPTTEKWREISKNWQPISVVPQHGAVVIWPNPTSISSESLVVLTIALQALDSLYKNNLVVKSQQTCRDFGLRVQKVWSNSQPRIAVLAGVELQWRTLLNHLAKEPLERYPEAFDPHILPSSLASPSVAQTLAEIHPQMSWWRDCEASVLGRGKNQTSLNVVDVALNYASAAEFGSNTKLAGRTALWDELLSRYMEHSNVFDKIMGEVELNSAPLATVRVETLSI